MSALVVTYHAVEAGPGPLFVEPAVFERHLDTIVESGAAVLTVSQLAAALRERRLPRRAVAITFDDGFASVARTAAPLLLERELTATVFCVAGWLGRSNDWPSQPSGTPRAPLATPAELTQLAERGIEIGAHGLTHSPLTGDESELRREIVHARRALEEAIGCTVGSFAYPYGVATSRLARVLVAETYEAACTTDLRAVTAGDVPLSIPRVDAHYLGRPALLGRALDGSLDRYLQVRRLGARARSALRTSPVFRR